jgi:hypothetical protein
MDSFALSNSSFDLWVLDVLNIDRLLEFLGLMGFRLSFYGGAHPKLIKSPCEPFPIWSRAGWASIQTVQIHLFG